MKIEKIIYEVDEAMIGGDEEINLKEFCNVLQTLCDEKCLFIEIKPIMDSYNGANHSSEIDPEYSIWHYEHFGSFPSNHIFDQIPWQEALEKYFK